jgi:hypothetical protein
MLRTSSSVGTATKHPESGTHVSPLKVPWAMLSGVVQRGWLSAGQLALSATPAHSSSEAIIGLGIAPQPLEEGRCRYHSGEELAAQQEGTQERPTRENGQRPHSNSTARTASFATSP